MGRIAKTLGGYVWWTYDRGSLHYDVMVTLILIFIFLAPLKINFKDKPATQDPHPNQITAYADEQGNVVYEVPAKLLPVAAQMSGPAALDAALAQALHPVAGAVTVVRYQPMPLIHGRVPGYRAWVKR